MLSPLTRQHLAAYTCPRCGHSLGRFHVYCLTAPVDVLRQTTEHGPMHLECAKEHAEAAHRAELEADPTFEKNLLYALYVVKGSPAAPSARLIRLLDNDEATAQLHLFTPEHITFYHQAIDGPHALVREAEYDEIEAAMHPCVTALLAACQSDDERQELQNQISRLHKHLPSRPKHSTSSPAVQ